MYDSCNGFRAPPVGSVLSAPWCVVASCLGCVCMNTKSVVGERGSIANSVISNLASYCLESLDVVDHSSRKLSVAVSSYQ